MFEAHKRLMQHRIRVAAATNNTMMMKYLLGTGISPDSCDSQGRTALHLASCR